MLSTTLARVLCRAPIAVLKLPAKAIEGLKTLITSSSGMKPADEDHSGGQPRAQLGLLTPLRRPAFNVHDLHDWFTLKLAGRITETPPSTSSMLLVLQA